MYRHVVPLTLIFLLAGCATSTPTPEPQTTVQVSDGTTNTDVTVQLDSYTIQINNPYMPLTPGLTYLYEGTVNGQAENVEVFVLQETRTVMDVECLVVRETVTVDGQKVEETFGWYAQDGLGNVWYFGEDSHTYENGIEVSTEGSWEAGVDGAASGIIMPAFLEVGDTYQPEKYPGVAEDQAEILSVSEAIQIGFGAFENVLQIKAWTPLESGYAEYKYYAPGLGLVVEVIAEGGEGRIELVEIRAAPPAQ